MEVIRKDVVVVGLGAFGSAALWRLAQRGAEVAEVERHGIGHQLGSSLGATRLFRVACQEHPGRRARPGEAITHGPSDLTILPKAVRVFRRMAMPAPVRAAAVAITNPQHISEIRNPTGVARAGNDRPDVQRSSCGSLTLADAVPEGTPLPSQQLDNHTRTLTNGRGAGRVGCGSRRCPEVTQCYRRPRAMSIGHWA